MKDVDDNLAPNYIRQWLDLCGITLSKNQFGLNLQVPSIKFTQCQTVCRNVLKSSPNIDIQTLWKNTSHGTNLQYDIYRNTTEVLKAVKSDNKDRLSQNLSSQGATITFLLKDSLEKLNGIWSSTQSNLQSNIFNKRPLTWRHNSGAFQAINGSSLYADLPGFLSPSI